MYVSPHFAERDLAILHDMIEAVRFGTLVLCADRPLAAHIPFVLNRDEGPCGTLVAHVARADPVARVLGEGREALAIFAGPRAYVSPQWRSEGGLPTYNYLAVHAHGRPRPLRDRDAALAHLAELAEVHERGTESPWSLDQADGERVERLLPHIAAFTLTIDTVEGKRKLSQECAVEEHEGILAGLRARGSDDDRAIAAAMAAYPYASRRVQVP
ncbi:MAG TPA: FMN-binding negative transcriptional regulator [Solirubrobacteraceae bacterium]|jgi:transcriptional regulator